MTDLVIGVRITADGSGLVGQVAPATAALRDVKQEALAAGQASAQLAGASAQAGQAARQTAAALDGEGRAAGQLEAILSRLEKTYDQAGAPMRRYMQDLADISRLQKAGVIDAEHAAMFTERAGSAYTAASDKMKRAGREQVRSLGEQKVGYQQLGFQVQDITQQLALGVNPLIVLAQQGGQTASALQMMGGKGAGVAGFFAGPFGSMVLAAVTVLGMLAMSAGQAEEKLEDAARGADSFGAAQSLLGQVMDLTTGKITNQNEVLREYIRLTALAGLQKAQKAESEAREGLLQSSYTPSMPMMTPGSTGGVTAPGRVAGGGNLTSELRSLAERYAENRVAGGIEQVRRELEALVSSKKTGGQSLTDLLPKFLELGVARNDQQAQQAVIDALDGKGLDPRLAKPGPKVRERRPRADNGAERLEEFGEDASSRLAGIAGRFADQPKAFEQARRALDEIDDLVDDIRRKKPLNLDELLADAEEAKTTVREGLIRGLAEPFEKQKQLVDRAREAMSALGQVADDFTAKKPPGWEGFLDQIDEARQKVQDGLNRPFAEFMRDQQESLQIQRLVNQGRDDEAEALQIILQLQQQMGPLDEKRKEAILASVQARRAEAREMEILQEKQQAYLDSLEDFRDIITDILSGDIKAILDTPKRLIESFKQLSAKVLFERLFGDAFRKLKDQVSGTNIVKDASVRMAAAVDSVAKDLKSFGRSLREAEAEVRGEPLPPQEGGEAPPAGDGDDVVITASRYPKDPAEFVKHIVTELLEGLLGKRVGEAFGRIAGQAIEGAAIGSMVGGVTKALGMRTSTTGSMVGGALGNVAGEALKEGITGVFGKALGSAAGPIGAVVGSLVGGLIGGAIRGHKTGSASIGMVDGQMGVTGTSGNSSKYRTAASGMGDSVVGVLEQIAAQFGGSLTGSPKVSIGIRDGNYRVDPTGRGNTRKKKGAVDFGEDQAAAEAYAALDALRDGAVTGLSAAVRKALTGSDDLQKALKEALKVDELETLLGGVDAELAKTFKAFERQAAERKRIAEKYGFDLVKLEEVNARERAKIFEDLIKRNVGAIQQLLQDMDFGDLFEGSAAEQRQKLLLEIAQAEADTRAGVEGAGDKVASLRRRLLELSREAFGTAGEEYAADRSSTRSAAEELIRLENERVKAAHDAQLAANAKLDQGNDLAEETNQLLSEVVSVTRATRELLASIFGGGSSPPPASGGSGGSTSRLVDMMGQRAL
jgi:hypothetical protein